MKQGPDDSKAVPLSADAPVPSPCIGICKMDAQSGLCEGCQRTIEEIRKWSTASDEWKRTVWEDIARRSGFSD